MSESSEHPGIKSPSVCPDCGGAITDILVNVPHHVRHHRPIEDGGWEVSDDVSSVTYIVRCSNAEDGHTYSEDNVPEAVTTRTKIGDHFSDTAHA
jgi:uncharacterized protein YcnI